MDVACRVFVYGTLKPGGYYYADYCAPSVIAVQEAIAWGRLYHLPMGYPALTEGDRPVQGSLLTFVSAEILDRLDDLEGYDPQRSPLENEYERRTTEVFGSDRQSLGLAWSYWMTEAQVQQWRGVLCEDNVWNGDRAPD